jgi:hypothetical protein
MPNFYPHIHMGIHQSIVLDLRASGHCYRDALAAERMRVQAPPSLKMPVEMLFVPDCLEDSRALEHDLEPLMVRCLCEETNSPRSHGQGSVILRRCHILVLVLSRRLLATSSPPFNQTSRWLQSPHRNASFLELGTWALLGRRCPYHSLCLPDSS